MLSRLLEHKGHFQSILAQLASPPQEQQRRREGRQQEQGGELQPTTPGRFRVGQAQQPASPPESPSSIKTFYFDGTPLPTSVLSELGRSTRFKFDLSATAWRTVRLARAAVDAAIAGAVSETANINEGGLEGGPSLQETISLSDRTKSPALTEKLEQVQSELVRTHATGSGRPLSVTNARMLLALRINSLITAQTAVRPEVRTRGK